MKIQITVWINGNGQENHETVTISEKDICQLAEEKIKETYDTDDITIKASHGSMVILDL